MKYKVTLLLFVTILSLLVFFSIFQSLHMSHLLRLETFPIALLEADDIRSEVVINYRLANPSESQLPQPELLDYIAEIAVRDRVSVILWGSELNESRGTKTYFVLGDDFTLDPVVGDTLAWSDPNEKRFLAIGHPENPIHLLSRNYQRSDLVIRPWNQIDEFFKASLGLYSVLIYTRDDPAKYLNDNKLFSFDDPANRGDAFFQTIDDMIHVKQGDYYSSHSWWIILSMVGLLIILVYFLLVGDKKKEIAVRHLNGQSNRKITLALFSRLNLILLFAWILPMIVLSVALDTGWSMLAFTLYRQLFFTGIVFLIGLLIANVIACIYIKRTGFSALKQSGRPTIMSDAMYGIKLVFLILCISFMVTFWTNIQGYRSVRKHVEMYGSRPMYEVMLTSGADKHGINYPMLLDVIDDYTVYFETIQTIDRSRSAPGERPAFLHQTVVADPKLTDYADLILLDGSVFKPEPGKKYLLYPPGMDLETYFDSPEVNQSAEGVELIEIRPDQNIMLPHEFGAVYNNYAGFSFFLSEDIQSNHYQSYLIDRRVHPWNEVSDHLAANGIPRWAVKPLYKNPGGAIEEMEFTLHTDERNMVIAGFSFIIAIIITYSFTKIYIDDHRKRLAVSYLFGESFIRRYGYLFSAWLIIYASLMLFFIFFQYLAGILIQLNYSPNLMPTYQYDLATILKIILAFVIGDGLLSLYFIRRLEIGVVRALKGGEL